MSMPASPTADYGDCERNYMLQERQSMPIRSPWPFPCAKHSYDQLATCARQMYDQIMAIVPAQDIPLLLEALKVCQTDMQPLPKLYAYFKAMTAYLFYCKLLVYVQCLQVCTCVSHSSFGMSITDIAQDVSGLQTIQAMPIMSRWMPLHQAGMVTAPTQSPDTGTHRQDNPLLEACSVSFNAGMLVI